MADNRSRLEKYLGMLGSDQMGERAAAALKIHELAKAENKTIVELCMGPQSQRQESRHPQQEPRRDPSYNPFRQRGSSFSDDFFADIERRARAAQREAAAAAAKREAESAKQRYSGAFDDAEMTDEERQAARAHKAEQKRRQRPKNRPLLDELHQAYSSYDDDGSLEHWEKEFAATVPHQYRADYELSAKQERTARMIIAKIRRNQGESPI
jgi:hypothetical protein